MRFGVFGRVASRLIDHATRGTYALDRILYRVDDWLGCEGPYEPKPEVPMGTDTWFHGPIRSGPDPLRHARGREAHPSMNPHWDPGAMDVAELARRLDPGPASKYDRPGA